MNVGEYGIKFVFSTAFNMSSNTSIGIVFTKPSGAILSVANPNVTVPSTSLTTTLGLFLANKYAQYTFQNGDVNEIGLWSVRVYYTDATPQHLISDVSTFTVAP